MQCGLGEKKPRYCIYALPFFVIICSLFPDFIRKDSVVDISRPPALHLRLLYETVCWVFKNRNVATTCTARQKFPTCSVQLQVQKKAIVHRSISLSCIIITLIYSVEDYYHFGCGAV
jgi:hypothetical protein